MKRIVIKLPPNRDLDRLIRREMPPPTKTFRDESRYNRKQKFRKGWVDA
jgi:hypothetical protein